MKKVKKKKPGEENKDDEPIDEGDSTAPSTLKADTVYYMN